AARHIFGRPPPARRALAARLPAVRCRRGSADRGRTRRLALLALLALAGLFLRELAAAGAPGLPPLRRPALLEPFPEVRRLRPLHDPRVGVRTKHTLTFRGLTDLPWSPAARYTRTILCRVPAARTRNRAPGAALARKDVLSWRASPTTPADAGV